MKSFLTWLLFLISFTLTALPIKIAWDTPSSPDREYREIIAGPYTSNEVYLVYGSNSFPYTVYTTKTNDSLFLVRYTDSIQLSGYKIYMGSTPGVYSTIVSVGLTNAYVVDIPVELGIKLYARVAAIAAYSGVESDSSSEIVFPGNATNLLDMRMSRANPGTIHLTMQPIPNKTYVMQFSEDLVNWTSIKVYPYNTPWIEMTITNTYLKAFYRAIPN